MKVINYVSTAKDAMNNLKPKQRGALLLILALLCVAGAFYALFTDKVDHYTAFGLGLFGFFGFYKLYGPGYDALMGSAKPGANQ